MWHAENSRGLTSRKVQVVAKCWLSKTSLAMLGRRKKGKATDEIHKQNPPTPKAGPVADEECFHCKGKGQ